MDMQGDPNGDPVKSGVTIGDYVGAFNAYGAIVTALYYKKNTGEGQFIDISLLDGLISIMTPMEGAATLDLKPTRAGRHHNTLAPYGIYRSDKGDSVIIAAFSAGQWSKLCNAIGKPELLEDERFLSIAAVRQTSRILKRYFRAGSAPSTPSRKRSLFSTRPALPAARSAPSTR